MPKEVIDRVNALGKSEGQPTMMTFYDRKGLLIGDTETPGSAPEDQPAYDEYDDEADGLDPPLVNETFGLEEDPTELPDLQDQLQQDPIQPQQLQPAAETDDDRTYVHLEESTPEDTTTQPTEFESPTADPGVGRSRRI